LAKDVLSPRGNFYNRDHEYDPKTAEKGAYKKSKQKKLSEKQELSKTTTTNVAPVLGLEQTHQTVKVCIAAQSAFELLKAHRHSNHSHQQQAPSPKPQQPQLKLQSQAHLSQFQPPPTPATAAFLPLPQNNINLPTVPTTDVCNNNKHTKAAAKIFTKTTKTVAKKTNQPLLPSTVPASGTHNISCFGLPHHQNNIRTFDNCSYEPTTGITTTLRGSRCIQQTSSAIDKEHSSHHRQHHRYDLDLVYAACNTSSLSSSFPVVTDIMHDNGVEIRNTTNTNNSSASAPTPPSSVLVKYLVRKPIAVAKALSNEVWETFSPRSQ
jgi:hypothetical protein